jgi:hypothetical protein
MFTNFWCLRRFLFFDCTYKSMFKELVQANCTFELILASVFWVSNSSSNRLIWDLLNFCTWFLKNLTVLSIDVVAATLFILSFGWGFFVFYVVQIPWDFVKLIKLRSVDGSDVGIAKWTPYDFIHLVNIDRRNLR